MELIHALGLDWKILLAQFINFAILVFVLWKFGYKPVLNLLKERQDKISKGIEDAQKATEKLAEISEQEKQVLKEAKIEAAKIIDQAKEDGEKRKKELVAKAKEEVKQIIDQEKVKIKAERQEAMNQVKKEVADLVIVAVEKVLKEKMDEDKDQKLIRKIVKQLDK